MKTSVWIILIMAALVISCGKSSTSESERAEKKIEVERNAYGNEIEEKKITIDIKSNPVDVNTDMLLLAKKLLQDTVRQKPFTTFRRSASTRIHNAGQGDSSRGRRVEDPKRGIGYSL